jgi:hypothetical protein
LLKVGQTLDAVFIDVHQSFNAGTTIYSSMDVVANVVRLLEAGVASPSLTIVIDNTVGLLRSSDIAHILTVFRSQIASGRLSVALNWSAQKFDSFGSDKITAGPIVLYSNNVALLKKFNDLNRGDTVDDIDTHDVQMLSHVYSHAANLLDAYKELIFANAHYLYSRISPTLIADCMGNETFHRPVVVACKKDRDLFFIDVSIGNLPWFKPGEYETISRKFISYVKRHTPIEARNSFGFRRTTTFAESIRYTNEITRAERYKYRIAVGVEDRAKVDTIAAAINHAGTVLNTIAAEISSDPALQNAVALGRLLDERL